MFEEVLAKIGKFESIIIHRHSNPDGDALGSQTGLKFIINENWPDKKVYITGDSPARYSFMKGCTPDLLDDGEFTHSLCIILDCAEEHLVSDERYKNAPDTIRFDHHIFCKQFAKTEIIITEFESCASIVTKFAMDCNLKVNSDAAAALFTGIVTDSGRFRYDSTTSGTFERVSFLYSKNINADSIYSNLYCTPFKQLKLKAKFINKIKFYTPEIAYIYTTKEEMKELNEEFGIDLFGVCRGQVNIMSDIEGVNNWVNFTENEEKGNVWVELRSSNCNIQPIAVKYGGGGHAKACGCDTEDYEDSMRLLEDLKQFTES